MKILLISPTSSGIGGIAQHVINLSSFLKNHGHDVDIISSENTLTIPISGLKNLSFVFFAFFKNFKSHNYDIIHVQNPLSAICFKKIQGRRVVSLQGMYADNITSLHGKIFGKLAQKLENKVLKWADELIVSSQDMYEIYSKKYSNVNLIPNAINTHSFPNEMERKFSKQIIYAARLSKEKGILDVLSTAKSLPKDIDLIIIGSGPEEKQVQTLSVKHSNVHFLGIQNKLNTIKLIRGSDILLQPSLLEAGTSTTILESMACKTAVISSSIGGNKEAIKHLKTGYIVDINAPNQILEGIQYLFSNNDERMKIIENAYQNVKQNDWNEIGKKYETVYLKLLNQK